jgi:hypothetical protein
MVNYIQPPNDRSDEMEGTRMRLRLGNGLRRARNLVRAFDIRHAFDGQFV